jgi:3-oxoadipate enol-lactonase
VPTANTAFKEARQVIAALAREEARGPVRAELHHTDSGGQGEAVVLVHAIGCDLRMWDSLEAALAPRFRVVRVDLRGHGASPVIAGPCTLEDLADDVAAVLDRVRVPCAHWVGLSLGGMIGQAFALAHPARLGRLVLANTTAGYGAQGHAMWSARAQAVRDGGMEAIVDLAMERYFSDAFRARHADGSSRWLPGSSRPRRRAMSPPAARSPASTMRGAWERSARRPS